MSLAITPRTDGDVLTLFFVGRLETTTAPTFQTILDGIPSEINSLVLDFEKLDYTSSAGLRCLLIAHKAFADKGGLKLVHVCKEVLEVLEMTGFTDILKIE
ncbi:MAG: STAS domain-containing protein [Bacilli bacterium]|nr:STAS domain-containing protein [Bacilli bacterium]